MAARILVAGIGNIFLGDDGFGSEVLGDVADRLAGCESVRVVDYGIGGLHLAYDLLDDWEAMILVDALPNRGSPGSVHVFEADHAAPERNPALDAHAMDPATVFASLEALGGTAPRTIVVGCEVADVADGIGLSAVVRAAVPEAAAAVEAAVAMVQTAALREV
jgi:hydrogenase maturation protease